MSVKGSIRRRLGMLIAVTATMISAGNASADTVECVYDGYVAMGGMVCNTTNSYMLPGNPDWEPTEGMETFCYAFVKFDSAALPAAQVGSAVLQLEVISLQDGMSYPVTEEGVYGSVGAYAVSADVETISYGTCDAFRDHIAAEPASVAQIDAPGGTGFFPSGTFVSLDVTDLVNEWITSGNNYGLVLACKQGYTLRLHSSDSSSGTGPTITTGEGITAGDLNGDSLVDMDDLPHFLDALLGNAPAGQQIDQSRGDMNSDGNVDGNDIVSFVAALTE